MSAGSRRLLVTLVAALVVASVALAGVGGAQDRSSGPSPAEEIYVEDDGDAVLVYADETATDDERTEFGVNVAEGLVYSLFEDPVEETPEVRGGFSAVAEPGGLTASGSLSAPQPPELENLEFEFSGESTSQVSRSDLTLSTTIVDESGLTQLVRSAETSGEMTTSASRFQLSGEFQADSVVPVGEDSRLAASLSEDDGTYTLSVEQDEPISSLEADAWRNRSVAEQTLREQFVAPTGPTDASASVALDSYSLTERSDGRFRLDVSYTVTFSGVDRALEASVRDALAEAPDVSASDADRLTTELREATVNEASFAYEVENGDPSAEFTLDVSEYEGLALAYLELASELQADQPGAANAEQARKQFEARAAADMVQRVTWSGSLSHPDGDRVQVDASIQSRTDNWQAYVDELEARDLPRFDSTFELVGSTDGERVSFDGSAEFGGEDLFTESLESMDEAAAADPEAARWIEAVREAQPRQAKFETSYDGDGLRVETAAAFENLAAIRDELAREEGFPTVTEAVGRSDEGAAYVRVSDAVSGGASADEVRSLSAVDDETTVHMPGEWDREFPSMDTDRARSFLDADGSGAITPGFGPVAALVALLAAALLAIRRRP